MGILIPSELDIIIITLILNKNKQHQELLQHREYRSRNIWGVLGKGKSFLWLLVSEDRTYDWMGY